MKRIFGLLLLTLITINCYSQNKVRGKLTTEINGFQWYNYKNKEAYTVDGRLLFKDDASKQIVFTVADNNDEGLFVVSYKNDKRLYYSNGNEIKYYTAGDLSYFTLEFERISIEYSQPYNKKYYTLVTYYSKIDNKKLYSYLIDLDGKLVTPCFDSYRIERNFIITTYKGNMWLIHANRPGASLEYTSIKFNDRSKCYVCKSSSAPFELFLINESGEMIGVAESITDKGDYMLIKYNHGLGVVSNVGKYVISTDCGYTSISKTNGNTQYYKVGKNGYYGLIDLSGKEIIPINRDYTSIGDFNTTNKTFAFTKKGYSGVCNEQGEEISLTKLPPTADDIKETGNYASATELMNGSIKYWKVSKGGRYGLTDAEGKVIVPTEMEALELAGTGYLRYKLNGFWGLMDYAGKIIIDTDRGYTSIGNFVTFTKRFPYTMTGWKGECDINGRQVSKIKVETPKTNVSSSSSTSKTSSSNYEDFTYYSYYLIENGSLTVGGKKETCDKVRFIFDSNRQRIIVSLMDKEKTIESMTIIPSESTLIEQSGMKIISFRESGKSKKVSIIQSQDGESQEIITWIEDNKIGKFFGGQLGKGREQSKLGVLLDFVNGYQGQDFNAQYKRVETELEKYSWKVKK